MSLPPALGPEQTGRLPGAGSVPVARTPSPPGTGLEPDSVAGPGGPRLLHTARRGARRALVRIVRRAVAVGAGEQWQLAQQAAAETVRLREALSSLERNAAVLQLDRRASDLALMGRQVEANRVNLELLKAEFRALLHTVEELGHAFAPSAGLPGAGARFAELRERLATVERRLRRLDGAATPAPAPPAGSAPFAGPTEGLTPFDYLGFERRFRGDPTDIVRVQQERYGDLLAAHQPVLDLGCGRGELLEALLARGVHAEGVEPDPGMAAEARDRGVTVHATDAVSFLAGAAPRSLGAVFSAHLAEHLHLSDLLALIELSASRLRPGGVFVAETPNPAALIVLGNSYVLDPTHVRPLHPALMAFLCENAGFRDVRLAFYSPASGYHLPLVTDPAAPPWVAQVNAAFTQLNDVLFGPQEYAVIATTPPDVAGDSGG
ncbi:MAG: methyltransferase domain-containing protein [Actinomycetota bacterium]